MLGNKPKNEDKKQGKPKQVRMRSRVFASNQDMIDAVNEYLEECDINTQFPNISGFCVFCGMHRDTYYDQEKLYPEGYKMSVEMLESAALNGKNAGDVLKIFYMKNRLGYKDKQDVNYTNKNTAYDNMNKEELLKLAEDE